MNELPRRDTGFVQITLGTGGAEKTRRSHREWSQKLQTWSVTRAPTRCKLEKNSEM